MLFDFLRGAKINTRIGVELTHAIPIVFYVVDVDEVGGVLKIISVVDNLMSASSNWLARVQVLGTIGSRIEAVDQVALVSLT